MLWSGGGRDLTLDNHQLERHLRQPLRLSLSKEEGIDGEVLADMAWQEELVLVVDGRAGLEEAVGIERRKGIVDEIADPIGRKGDAHLIAAEPAAFVPQPGRLEVLLDRLVELAHRQV